MLIGQDCGGDAKKRVDAVVQMIERQNKDASLF
jgi:hypothetical protein